MTVREKSRLLTMLFWLLLCLDNEILQAFRMLIQVEAEDERFRKHYYHISQQDWEKSKGIDWLTLDFSNISGCEVNTSVPVECDTPYDSTMNYRNICHRYCVQEAGLNLELNDALLYCSQRVRTRVIHIVLKKSKTMHNKKSTCTSGHGDGGIGS